MTEPSPIGDPDKFMQDLSINVAALTVTVADLAELFRDDKARARVQRKNDKRIVRAIATLAVIGALVQGYNIARQNGNCTATNQSNKVVRDLFESFKGAAVKPSPVPSGLSTQAAATFRKADEARIAGARQFYAQLEKQTAHRSC